MIELAGYTNSLTVVIKYRHGLNQSIQDQLAQMTMGQPRDNTLADWYNATLITDENRIANEAFMASHMQWSQPPFAPKTSSMVTIPPPAPHTTTVPVPNWPPMVTPLLPRSTLAPVPMEVDTACQCPTTTLTCYRCRQSGHTRRDCPQVHDLRFMMAEEKEDCIQQLLAEKEAAVATVPVITESDIEEDF